MNCLLSLLNLDIHTPHTKRTTLLSNALINKSVTLFKCFVYCCFVDGKVYFYVFLFINILSQLCIHCVISKTGTKELIILNLSCSSTLFLFHTLTYVPVFKHTHTMFIKQKSTRKQQTLQQQQYYILYKKRTT